MPLPIVADAKLEHPLNTPVPSVVTVLGIDIEVNPVFENALLPIFLTEAGMLTDVNPEQPMNALLGIYRT